MVRYCSGEVGPRGARGAKGDFGESGRAGRPGQDAEVSFFNISVDLHFKLRKVLKNSVSISYVIITISSESSGENKVGTSVPKS